MSLRVAESKNNGWDLVIYKRGYNTSMKRIRAELFFDAVLSCEAFCFGFLLLWCCVLW